MLFEICLLVGLLATASNPSPVYGAFGLVWGAGFGCLLLIDRGVTFLGIILFIIYLGGMMVVFGYSAALVGETYPKAWGSPIVITYLVLFTVFLIFSYELWVEFCVHLLRYFEFEGVEPHLVATSKIYSEGGWLLFLVGWGLLLTLFVVLEVVRGRYSGALRNV
uniref:NADH-ubiquinone oxidoreductase chain 6 n=1 Tax=Leptopelis vermiculatus TaxID=39602 RepID=S4V020_9NEOB|nr:NADH dehydrogenase subunit 6 [Leptopelis vermiculatus]